MSFVSRSVFMSKEVTSAWFISAGTVADFNDMFMIFASTGAIILMFVLSVSSATDLDRTILKNICS